MNKLDLIILFGGRSSEHEVSCRSAFAVINNLDREKYNVIPVGITKDGKWYQYTGRTERIADGTWLTNREHLYPVTPDIAAQTHRFHTIRGASLWTLPCCFPRQNLIRMLSSKKWANVG